MQVGPKQFVDQYSVKFQQKLGRVVHDLHLLTAILAMKNTIASGEAFAEGYSRQSTTLMNTTVRSIFKSTNGGMSFVVANHPFCINIDGIGVFEIPGGIVNEIYMGAFPYDTHLIIYGAGQWFCVGAKPKK